MNDEEFIKRFADAAAISDDAKMLSKNIRRASEEAIMLVYESNTGQSARRAICKAELERRQYEQSNNVFVKQIGLMEKQAKIAEDSAIATKLAAYIAFGLLFVSFLQMIISVIR